MSESELIASTVGIAGGFLAANGLQFILTKMVGLTEFTAAKIGVIVFGMFWLGVYVFS